MNKKLLSLVIVLCLSITVFSGCANNSENAESNSVSAETNDNTDAPQSKYEEFLNGNGDVYFNRYNPNKYNGYDYETEEFAKAYEENTPYKLTDIIRLDASAVSEGYYDADDEFIESMADVRSCDYAYIDLGRDGVEELALSITYVSDASYTDATYTYIIKEFDSKLEVVYRLEGLYRSYEDLNTNYGLINSYGSYSYAQGIDNLFYLDGEGKLNTIYRSEFSYLIDEYFFGSEVLEDYSTEEYENVQFYRYIFNDYPDDIEDIYEFFRDNGVYSIGFNDSDLDFKDLATISKVTFVDEEELNELIKKRKEEVGCPTDDYNESDDVIWNNLDNSEVNEIITYGFNPKYVDNSEDFILSIADNTTIVIDSNSELNVSEYIDANLDSLSEWDYEDNNPDPGVYYRWVNDGYELVIYHLNNIKIFSSDEGKKPSIVCEPRYANVISFDYCGYITLNGLYMGHTTEEGYCSGAVINFSNCVNNLTVDSCELYGCGTYGITSYDSNYVDVNNTIIRDCSYGCIDAGNTSLMNFDSCTFKDCREFTMFDMRYTDAWFSNCNFKNLDGEMINLTKDNYASFNSCTFDKNALDSLESYNGDGEVRIN